MTPRPADWLAIIALGLIWGSSFMAAKVALSDFGPITIAAGRIVLGAALLLAVVAVTGRDMPKGARSWAHTILFGLFSNALPFFLLNWAQQTVTSSFAGIAQATVPLFVLPLALILVPGERFAWYKLAGLVVGFFGVVLLIGPTELLSGPSAAVPRLACIAAALCYAIGSIVTRLAPPTDQIGYSASALAVAAVLTVPAALMFEGTPDVPSLRGGLSLLYLAVGPTALAALILVRTVRSAGPVFVSLVNYMVPPWSIVLGVLVLAEVLPGSFLIAMTVILTGLALSQWPALRLTLTS